MINHRRRAGGAASEWFTVVDYGEQTNADSDWRGYTVRLVIPASELLTSTGTSIRLTLLFYGVSKAIHYDELWLGHAAASGDPYDFDGNQVQILSGGSGAFDVPASATESLLTDEVDFDFDGSKNLVLSAYFNGTDSNDDLSYTLSASSASSYYKSSTNDASTTNAASYTSWSSSRNLMIRKLEAYGISP